MIAASPPEVLTPAAPSDPFRASVASSACALNESHAALPAPLDFPSSGSAAFSEATPVRIETRTDGVCGLTSPPTSALAPSALPPRTVPRRTTGHPTESSYYAVG
jgi:hypothetical protein